MEEDTNKRFVRAANPHSWLLAADDLHEQAVAQYRRRDGSILLIRKDAEATSSDRVDKSIFYLGDLRLRMQLKHFSSMRILFGFQAAGCRQS